MFSPYAAIRRQDGEMIFNGRFPEGGNSYRAYRFPWSAQPAEPPDAKASPSQNP